MAFTFCTNCGEQIDVSFEKCPHCGHPTGAHKNYTYGMDPNAVNKQQSQFDQNGQAPQNNQTPGDSQNNGMGGMGNMDDQRPPQNNGSPYGQNPYGQNQNPYGQNQNPYGQNQNPYGQNQNPYGQNQNPYGQNQNPYGQNQNPYGQNPYGQTPYGQTPYGQNQNPYGQNQNPYGNLYRRPANFQQKRPISTGLVIFSVLNIFFGCLCFGMIFGIIGLVFATQAQTAPTDRDEIVKKKLSLAMNVIGTILTIAYVVSYAIVLFKTGIDLSMFM